MDFSALKKNRGNNLSQIRDQINKGNESKDFSDSRFWTPTLDAASNGFAIIRFLPAPPNEEMPYVKVYSHGFENNGRWFIENCPTTIRNGRDVCPVCAANNELWNSKIERNQEVARKRKRQLRYISNIMVVSDPKNPDAEGKVFLFNYGKKIFEKIMASIEPEFEDETPVNPFDLWEGANFRLKIRLKDNFRNYDKSSFDEPSLLGGFDDDKLKEVWESEHSLSAFLAPSEFKSYDELQKRFDEVISSNRKPRAQTAPEFEDGEGENTNPLQDPDDRMNRLRDEKSDPPFDVDNNVDDDLALYADLLKDD